MKPPTASFAALMMLGITSASRAQCDSYEAEAFRTPNCGLEGFVSVNPMAISETGVIVGYWSTCISGSLAFQWVNGPTIASLPAGSETLNSRAHDVNRLNDVVGYRNFTSGAPLTGQHAFCFSNGSYTNLVMAPGTEYPFYEALAINDDGHAVGYGYPVLYPQACLWQDDNVFPLVLPVGPSSNANDINNHNQIVGWMGVSPGAQFIAEPFLWQDGVVVGLGLPKGSLSGEAVAISDTGHIAGQHYVEIAPGFRRRRGFHWKDGVFTDLGVLPPHDTVNVGGINDRGEIVGYCTTSTGGSATPFIYRDGVMTDLRPLVPLPAHLSLRSAHDINNLGQIAAEGRDTADPQDPHSPGFRLTPSSTIPGDLDRNCLVNIDDLLGVIGQWGPVPAGGRNPADFNRDQIVNVADLLVVIHHWMG